MTLPQQKRPENLERAVLVTVLHAHPKGYTLTELLREFEAEDPARGGSDEALVRAAVDGLESFGLVQRDGASICATAAAVHQDHLLGHTI